MQNKSSTYKSVARKSKKTKSLQRQKNPSANRRNHNPFERQYANGFIKPAENFGSTQSCGTNFLTQTFLPKNGFEISSFLNKNTYANTALDLQNFIKTHFPVLYPHIKKSIKSIWDDKEDALGFINSCIKAFETANPNYKIDIRKDEYSCIVFVYYSYECNEESYGIEFKPFLALKETHPEQYEILINLYRFVLRKLDHWHTNELEFVEDMVQSWQEDQSEEEIEEMDKRIMEYKNGLPLTTLYEIIKSKIKLPQLKYKVAELDEFSSWDIDFKNMCISAIELIETKGQIQDYAYCDSKEENENEPVMPHEYCSIFWETSEECPFFYYSEEMIQAKWNEGGIMEFRYVQNITEQQKFSTKIPDFPDKVKKFLTDSITFQNNHLYERRK